MKNIALIFLSGLLFLGMLYFGYQILISHFWLVVPSFLIGSFFTFFLMAILKQASKSDSSFLEMDNTLLRNSLEEEKLNYDNMRAANEALQDKLNLLEKTIEFKNKALALSFTENDRLRKIINEKGSLSIDKDGKIIS